MAFQTYVSHRSMQFCLYIYWSFQHHVSDIDKITASFFCLSIQNTHLTSKVHHINVIISSSALVQTPAPTISPYKAILTSFLAKTFVYLTYFLNRYFIYMGAPDNVQYRKHLRYYIFYDRSRWPKICTDWSTTWRSSARGLIPNELQ